MSLPRSILVVVTVALGACATPVAGPPEPVVSPTGILYELGAPPVDTRFSQTATLHLRQERTLRALELAKEGIADDPGNPIHYFLAGQAHVRLGEYEDADEMFLEAQRLYPGYEIDIEREREAGWAKAFNVGGEAYVAGDLERTVEAWTQAMSIYDLRPEAHRNLASLLVADGRYEEAIGAYQGGLAGLEKLPVTRVLDADEIERRAEQKIAMEEDVVPLLVFTERFAEAEVLIRRQLTRDPTSTELRGGLAAALQGQGRAQEAAAIYTALLSEAELQATELFNLGIALFRASEFLAAGEAFERLTGLQSMSRDAWFNYANALFAAEAWERLARVGDRLVELDPLGENAGLITARAHLESGDQDAALRALERTESAPVYLEGLLMRPSGVETMVQGRVVGNVAEAGTRVRLRFTFYGDDGELGKEDVTVSAPLSGESIGFEVSFGTRASAYRYELIREGAAEAR